MYISHFNIIYVYYKYTHNILKEVIHDNASQKSQRLSVFNFVSLRTSNIFSHKVLFLSQSTLVFYKARLGIISRSVLKL